MSTRHIRKEIRMQAQKAAEAGKTRPGEEGKLEEVESTHDAPRDGSKKVKWDAPTNSYAFEMGFHPDNCAGL